MKRDPFQEQTGISFRGNLEAGRFSIIKRYRDYVRLPHQVERPITADPLSLSFTPPTGASKLEVMRYARFFR